MGQPTFKARVRRDCEWQDISAADMVLGAIVRVRLGDVMPAGMKLLEGDYHCIGQSR